jgi:hypothetical protein
MPPTNSTNSFARFNQPLENSVGTVAPYLTALVALPLQPNV